VTYTNEGLYSPEVLWTSPSGGTLIGALFPLEDTAADLAHGLRIGVISHGTFTPVRLPPSLATSIVQAVAF